MARLGVTPRPDSNPMIPRLLRLVAPLLGAIGALAAPYEPQADFSLSEKWRWNELDQLQDYLLFHGAETLDGQLVFASQSSLVFYDGYKIEEVPYPVVLENMVPQGMFRSHTGRIYLHSNYGLWSWRENEWRIDLEYETPMISVRSRFSRSPYGVELFGGITGLYRLDRDVLEQVPEFSNPIASIAFDARNRLWISNGFGLHVTRIQMERDTFPASMELEAFDLEYVDDAFPWLVTGPETEDVWTASWRADMAPKRFDHESESWIEEDMRHLPGANAHSAGMMLAGSDLALFSKGALSVLREGEWQSLGYPQFDIPNNSPFVIHRANGRLILGGRGEKIYEIDYTAKPADSFRGLHFQCDLEGVSRWFISIDGRIIEQNTIYDTWTHHDQNVIDTPLVMIASSDGTIWAAGAHDEVAAVSYYDGRSWTRETFPKLNSFISHLSAYELPGGGIFFGSGHDVTTVPNGGAVVFRKSRSGFEAEYLAPPRVPMRPVGVAQDGAGDVWFGGLFLAQAKPDFTEDFARKDTFETEAWIDHIESDHEGDAWAALWELGLFEHRDGEWEAHRGDDKIASRQVSYIMRDEVRPGNMWFGTIRGVSRFDGSRWFPHALPPELSFNRESGTLAQSSDGAIWVNMATRPWYFRKTPGFFLTRNLHDTFKTVRFQPDTEPPVVAITSEVPQSVAPANVLVTWLGTDKWSNTPTERLKYSYRVNDEPWSEFVEGTSQALLDIPAGSHTFEVRALDLDGNLSQINASTMFVIVPPVWQRAWFIALILVTLIVIGFLVYLLFQQRIRHLIQMEEFKLQFFTNISHELRTPLTVILGPLESQLAKLPSGWDKRPLEIAHKNAQRTLSLIDQILDFRRAETGRIKINLARSDLVATVREAYELLKPLAEDRQQSITLDCRHEKCVVWHDAEIVERILSNLISNAVKYTQQGGEISVKLRLTALHEVVSMELVVEDNGTGINIGKIDDIFEVFYRASSSRQQRIRGSGIGLAYTKNLVEACNGKIEVESPVTKVAGKKQGTRFTVSLPLRTVNEKAKLAPDEAGDEPVTAKEESALEEFSESALEDASHTPVLVMAEDDEEIREFLSTELNEHYKVITAENGVVALEQCRRHIPDLLITDVMMPEMDGKELCRQIKTDESTSHIPIVMLTALKSEMHELEGLEIGADDYLTKPIRLQILKQRIHNLLETRRRLHNRFNEQKEEATVVSSEITTNPLDEAFLNKAVTLVEENVSDPLFDVEALADKLFMSRMTLYRKMKAITGDSPSAFIRSIRMNKAAALLATGEHNVSETADLVGMSDLSSFSTAFKKHFKVSPSQYTRRNG